MTAKILSKIAEIKKKWRRASKAEGELHSPLECPICNSFKEKLVTLSALEKEVKGLDCYIGEWSEEAEKTLGSIWKELERL